MEMMLRGRDRAGRSLRRGRRDIRSIKSLFFTVCWRDSFFFRCFGIFGGKKGADSNLAGSSKTKPRAGDLWKVASLRYLEPIGKNLQVGGKRVERLCCRYSWKQFQVLNSAPTHGEDGLYG